MKKVAVHFILIVSIPIFIMSIFPIFDSPESKYERICDKYEMKFFKLYVEIVKPAVDIEDIDEFFHYFKRGEILIKIYEAEDIVETIKSIVKEHNLSELRYRGIDNSIFPLKLLAEIVLDWEEIKKNEEIKELLDSGRFSSLKELLENSVNGVYGYRQVLRADLEAYEGIVDYQNNKR